MTDSINVSFETEKETKNAIRFTEVLEDGRERGIVGSLYVLKSELEELGNPSNIIVTITAV